jgi:hypothetical protein
MPEMAWWHEILAGVEGIRRGSSAIRPSLMTAFLETPFQAPGAIADFRQPGVI